MPLGGMGSPKKEAVFTGLLAQAPARDDGHLKVFDSVGRFSPLAVPTRTANGSGRLQGGV